MEAECEGLEKHMAGSDDLNVAVQRTMHGGQSKLKPQKGRHYQTGLITPSRSNPYTQAKYQHAYEENDYQASYDFNSYEMGYRGNDNDSVFNERRYTHRTNEEIDNNARYEYKCMQEQYMQEEFGDSPQSKNGEWNEDRRNQRYQNHSGFSTE